MGEFTVGYTSYSGHGSGGNRIKYSSFTLPKKGIPLRGYIKTYNANGASFKVAIYNAAGDQLLAESDDGTIVGSSVVTSGPAYFTGASAIDPQGIILAQNMSGGRYGYGASGSHRHYVFTYTNAWPASLASGSTISATIVIWVVFDEVWDDSANLKAGFMIKQVASEDLQGEFLVLQWQEDLLGAFIVRHETSVDLPAGFDSQVSLNLPGELIVRHSTSLDLAGSFDSQVSLNLPGEFVIQREASANLAAEFLVLQWQEDLLGAFIVRHETSADLPGEFIVRQPGSVNLPGEFVIRHSTTENLYAEIVVRHSTTLDLPAEFVVKQWREDLPAEFDVRQTGTPQSLHGQFSVRQETSADLPGEFVIRHSTTENLYAEFEVGQGSLNLPAGFTVRHETSIDLPGEFIVRHSASRDLPAAFDGQVSLNLPAEFKVGQDSVNLLAGFHVQHFNSGSADLPAEFEVHIPWLDGWTYRKEVTLVEQAGGNYNDYPTIITVAYNAHMKNDFADCRFTEADKETPIPYGIVQKTDGVSCDFVIKRNYTSGCTLTVYLYYGNPGAADASVDHGPWALAWYLANGFGQNPSSYTNTTCSQYPRSASEAIPAWADIVFGGCTANGGYRAYYGRAKINGVAHKWASTVVCTGRGDAFQLKWKKYNCTIDMYDDAHFIIGASNTVTWGHFSGGNTGFWVSYYPEDPSVSFGAEEAKLYPASANLLGEFVVRQETSVDLPAGFDGQTSVDLLGEFVVRHGVSRDLYVEFVVGQWQENLFGEFGVRQETSIGLPGEFNIRQAGSVDLPAEFNVGLLFSSEDLLGEFIIRKPSSADLLCGFSIRHEASVNLSAEFTVRHIGIPLNLAAELIVRQEVSVNLPGEFIVRNVGIPVELLGRADVQQPGSAELLGKFEAQATAELLGKVEVQQSGSANLSAIFHVGQDSADLFADLIVRNADTKDLFAQFQIIGEHWLDGWNRRKSHRIVGTSAGAQTNYPVGIKVYQGAGVDGTESVYGVTFGAIYCNGETYDDFRSIRFTKWNGQTELDYWMEEKTDANFAIFWVEVDEIPADPAATHIYVYYDGPPSPTTSSGDATFAFFDDFEDEAIDDPPDPTKWTLYGESNGRYILIKANPAGDGQVCDIHHVPPGVYTRLNSKDWALQGEAAIGYRYRLENDPGGTYPLTLHYTYKIAGGLFHAWGLAGSDHEWKRYRSQSPGAGWKDIGGDPPWAANTWYRVEEKYLSTGAILNIDGTDYAAVPYSWSFGNGPQQVRLMERFSGSIEGSMYHDNVYVRKYRSPEPSHSFWGDEEQQETDLLATFHVGQDSVNLFAEFELQKSEDLFAKFIVRHSASEDLFAEFELQKSEDLFAKFIVVKSGSEDLFADLIIRNVGTQDLFADLIVRHSDTQDLFADFTVRHSASEDLFAELIVRHTDTQDLFAKTTIRQSTSEDLFAELVVRQTGSQDLFAELIIRHSATFDLPGEFIVQQEATEDLLAEFTIRHSATLSILGEFAVSHIGTPVELLGEFIARHPDSEDLLGEFVVRQEASTNLLGEFIVGHETSVELLGVFIVRQPSSEDLLGEFVIRHTATPLNLLAVFDVGDSVDLLGLFDVRQETSTNLLGEFIVGHETSADLLGEFISKNVGSANLLGEFVTRQSGSAEFLGKALIRHVGTPVELLGKAEIQQSASAELLGNAVIRQPSSTEFLGEFVVRHDASADLLGEFISKNVGSADLLGELVVRQEASVDLYAAFESQASVDLLGEFTVRQIATINLPSEFIVQHPATINLPGEFIVQHPATINLPGEFIVQHPATLDLPAEFIIRQKTSEDLLGELIVRHSATLNLLGKLIARHEASRDLLGEFISKNVGSEDLLGELIVRHSATLNLLGKLIARHSATLNLLGEFIVRQVTSEDLLGELVVRQEASVDLYAAFESQASVDLLGEFTVRQIATINLPGKFIVKHSAELDLPAKFQVTHSENLLAKLWIRHPYRLWTNRHYLNGIVELDETELNDALLEYVIQGIMDDIKSQLINEELLAYVYWTDITTTPKLIRRATAYGTVASLYSRDINNPNRRIVLGLRTIRIRAAEVRSAQERAMDYWESRMEKMMDLYLTSGNRRLMIVDTEDEEPVFSLEDIPFFSEDPYKIEVRSS